MLICGEVCKVGIVWKVQKVIFSIEICSIYNPLCVFLVIHIHNRLFSECCNGDIMVIFETEEVVISV